MNKNVRFEPAYDKRKEGFGIHGVQIRFVLSGELGAVQFLLMTPWYIGKRKFAHEDGYPLPADVGYHSPHPMYEDQQPISDECEFLNGKPCYYDGSGLAADAVFDVLIEQGDKGVWSYLEEYYEQTFGELK